ncbi:MAG: P-loop NTPase [Chlamydiales bacterium]
MNRMGINFERCRSIAIGSGKGGVGKSTVAINLAIALAQEGFQVGLLDADLFGPSIPVMLGLRKLSPRIERLPNGKEQTIPFSKFGIQTLSIGFFIEEARPAIWRGPAVHGILRKMIEEVAWDELDLLLIDLPPGTGDTLLSLSQLIKPLESLIVCTPQEVAMLDAVKAINAFFQLDIPILGIIENMAGFTAPETQQVYHLFGQGKARELSSRFDIPLLASLPIIPEIGQGGDEGQPSAFFAKSKPAGQCFQNLAKTFAENYLKVAVNPFLE